MSYGWSNYKRLVFYYFMMACVNAALFATGFVFSRGSNGTSNVPYFFPAMVLCVIDFVQFILVIRLLYKAKKFQRGNALHYVFVYLGLIWCVVGLIICASAGFCQGDATCYYDRNIWINRGIAIGIAVIHLFHLFWFVYLMKHTTGMPVRPPSSSTGGLSCCKSKQTPVIKSAHRVAPSGRNQPLLTPSGNSNLPPWQGGVDKRYSPNHQLSTLRIEMYRKNLNEKWQSGNVNLPPVQKPPPRKVALRSSSSSSSSSSDEAGPPLRIILSSSVVHPPVRRTHSSIDSAMHKRSMIDMSQLSFRKRKDKMSDSTSKQSDKTPRGGNQSLETDNKPGTSGQNIQRPPPPAYGDALSSAYNLEPVARRTSELDKNPYWLPSLPEADQSDINARPDNMYTGTAYPSSDVVVMHPTPLKRQSNLTSHTFSDTQ